MLGPGEAIIPKPVIFLKPPSAAVEAAGSPLTVSVTVPRGRGSCHYETEVVLRVGPDGGGFDAVTLGLDLTLRDEQNAAKKAGHPWEAAKVG
jgi:2-keto-4-pentenoate hydratase/2-oxohepta-3-ene-1,7-dioic acid hydratase in catechol pathway